MSPHYENAASCWRKILSDVAKHRGLLAEIEKFSVQSNAPAKIVFGTSGWRGEIGTDYTFTTVRIVTSAVIEMLRSDDAGIMREMGVRDFEEVRKRGVIVGHDNRFLGPEFSGEVIGLLQKAGIRVWYAGEATTPEFSAGIEMLNAACAINLTPSHNPANYGGFKFNPSDGGPAGSLITDRIEAIANRMMQEGAVCGPVPPGRAEEADLTALYLDYIVQRGTIGIEKIRDYLAREDCLVCIDNAHGATRGRARRILGESPKVISLRTGDDCLFGGIAPEPSEENMAGIEKALAASSARRKLGVFMDPDGDRIRLSDGSVQVPMNYFGAMALHFLRVHKNIRGIAVKSAGTSNLVNAVAAKLGVPVKETKVGFKNFRPYLRASSRERAIVAFEESDGISGYNHTLEKDAIFGLLLALEMMAVTGQSLGAYLREIMEEFGYFYPDRSGIAVDRSLAGELLAEKLSSISRNYPRGASLSIGGHERTVTDVITIDGTKLVFDDGSWLMIRPSGTEPKVRFYIEARTPEGKKEVFAAAERLTREALVA